MTLNAILGNSYDAEEIKRRVELGGLAPSILKSLCGIDAQIVDDERKREFPCPKCGGSTRFRVIDRAAGAVFCSHCCSTGADGSGDIFGAVRWALGVGFAEAVERVGKFIGEQKRQGKTPLEIRDYYYHDENGDAMWRV
ncbi:MAG: hypothetical protein HUK22_05805 [Thermoguttaceae bacterium]|nr:hypothetical protein [Thermoguttaceae bacterium]